MNNASTQNIPECSISDTNSQKKMAKGGDTERTLDKIREKDENEADERKIRFGGGCGEEESESNREEVLGGEREKFGCGNVKEIKETDRGEEYKGQVGGVNHEVKDEKGDRFGRETRGGEKCEMKGDNDEMKEGGSTEEKDGKEEAMKDHSDRNQGVDNVPVNNIRLQEGAENNENIPNEIGILRSETTDLEEGSTPMEVEEPGLVEDVVTPVLKLLIFNLVLPCIDIYLDVRLILSLRLHPQYFGCLLVIVVGLLLHFIFTCFAWWRLEPRAQKNWSWIFLILQIWPQMKAIQVRQNLIILDWCSKCMQTYVSPFSVFRQFG